MSGPNRTHTQATDLVNRPDKGKSRQVKLPFNFRIEIRRLYSLLNPDFDPEPVAVRIFRIHYVSKCKAPRCLERATIAAEKVDRAGRHVRQIELRDWHCEVVINRERAREMKIADQFQVARLKAGDFLESKKPNWGTMP